MLQTSPFDLKSRPAGPFPRWATRWANSMQSSSGKFSAPLRCPDWDKSPAQRAHKDIDTRWSKKDGQNTWLQEPRLGIARAGELDEPGLQFPANFQRTETLIRLRVFKFKSHCARGARNGLDSARKTVKNGRAVTRITRWKTRPEKSSQRRNGRGGVAGFYKMPLS